MSVSRRRFLTVAAAAGSAPLVFAASSASADKQIYRWQGIALGADASLQLSGLDRGAANRLIEGCLLEVERLERIFSLYRPDSALVELNRSGLLEMPPIDLVRLMQEAVFYGHMTDGAFDIAVQPLWRLYAERFRKAEAFTQSLSQDVAQLRALVDFRAIDIEAGRIAFSRPGMAVTLNGIAQGYITDRIAQYLLNQGMRDALVDMGEIRALGSHPEGRAWRVSIRTAENEGPAFDLHGALATSAANGVCFDRQGRFGHVLDPHSGLPMEGSRQVSVSAATACRADALSTAFLLLSDSAIAAIAARLPDVCAIG